METIIKFILNNQTVSTNLKPQSSLLDFIRNDRHLHGTKEVCREGDCGACTVLLGELIDGELKYHSVNSCIYPLGNAEGKHIVTIEGLNNNNNNLNFVQNEFVENSASQCGYCTPGFINSFTGYLLNTEELIFDEAKNAIAGNICRCTGYASILRALNSTLSKLKQNDFSNDPQQLVNKNIIPDYFLGIKQQLFELNLSKLKSLNTNTDIIIGGGTDLLVQKEEYLQDKNIFLASQKVKSGIFEENNSVHILAGTTFEDLKKSEILNKYFPDFGKQMNLIASLPIRNSATIAGNLVNASPIADISIILLALNAEIIYTIDEKTFTINLRNFYKDYKQLNIPENAIIAEVIFDKPDSNSHFNFEKVSKRTYLDIASVNTAIFLSSSDDFKINNVSISAGGVSPVPLFLAKTSDYLSNKYLNIENINSALAIIDDEISPISDVRGSKEYKSLLLKQLIKAHFIKLFPNQISVGDLL